METVQPPRDLTALFDPRSVAVIGASGDSAKWGYGVSRELLAAGASRRVYLVNQRGATVLGRPTLRRLTDVDGPVDLVAICVPAAGLLAAVRDSLSVGAKAIVAITAGLGETDARGREIEQEVLGLVRGAGAALVGPNCLGVVDTTTRLHVASDPVTPGTVAVLSQSGNLVLDLDLLLAGHGLGISRFVSLGNQVDVTLADLVRSCAVHPGTDAIAVYAEDVRDGRQFVAAARAAREAGKPVVLLAPGRSDAASRGAMSHTGSMTSPARVIDALCAAAGVHRVDSPSAMVVLLGALVQSRRALGQRVGILTDGGGHGAIACDVLESHGLSVPRLSDALGEQLCATLWDPSPVTNPVDLAGIGEQDPASYVRGICGLLASDEIDSVLLTGYFGGYTLDEGNRLGPRELAAAHDLVAAVHSQPKPVVVHSIFPDSRSVRVLAAGGLPVHRDIEAAARALAVLVGWPQSPEDDLAAPPPLRPLLDTDYSTVREALLAAGISFPPAERAHSGTEALAAARRLGFPVVLKAMGLVHKSDVGGVALQLEDEAAVTRAYAEILGRLSPAAVSVEKMVDLTDGVEVIVGARQDSRCGPVVMVGLGGVFAEVLQDVAFALAPVSVGTAHALLRSLRAAPLLAGARGGPVVDLDSLAELIVRVSRFAAAHPDLSDVEVNPVLASPRGCVALDARASRA